MRKLVLVATAAALTALAFVAPAEAQSADGTVTVVHGIPDLTVDVYVNDELTLDDFAPDTVTDPIALPAGGYNLKIRGATDPDTAEPVLEADATVTAGLNASIVAHLTDDGAPTITVFANDVSTIVAGQGRVTVRHTAAAPAVDVRAGGEVVFADLTNPNEATADLPATVVSADVVLAGTDTVAIGPTDLDVVAGTSTILYAVGSAEEQNLHLLVQAIGGLGAEAPAPDVVDTGTGGLAGTESSFPMWIVLTAGSSLLVAACGGLVLVRAARR
jgi:hypothetical protein